MRAKGAGSVNTWSGSTTVGYASPEARVPIPTSWRRKSCTASTRHTVKRKHDKVPSGYRLRRPTTRYRRFNPRHSVSENRGAPSTIEQEPVVLSASTKAGNFSERQDNSLSLE